MTLGWGLLMGLAAESCGRIWLPCLIYIQWWLCENYLHINMDGDYIVIHEELFVIRWVRTKPFRYVYVNVKFAKSLMTLKTYGKLIWLTVYESGHDSSQPHSPGWARPGARVPLSSLIFLIFPQTLLIIFLILALRVGESPIREGPGYVSGSNASWQVNHAEGSISMISFYSFVFKH